MLKDGIGKDPEIVAHSARCILHFLRARSNMHRLLALCLVSLSSGLLLNGPPQPPRSDTFSGRRSLIAAAALGLVPAPAFAQRSKMIARSSKEATAAAKAFKLSRPGEETEAFKAAERRRADVAAGRAPRDADRTPIRDPVSGKEVKSSRTYAEAIAAGDDYCKSARARCQ